MLRSARLVGCPWSVDDAGLAFELYSDERVVRYIGGTPQADLASMRARLTQLVERDRASPAGHGSFPCFGRDDGLLIGVALIKQLPGVDDLPTDDVEIGWHVRASHWNQGYATEMGRALVEHGLRGLGLEQLHVVVEPPNGASIAVARKLGATPLGRTRRYYGGRELEHLLVRP